METKKAYGVVTALGTKIGERAREEPSLIDQIRATRAPAALDATVRAAAQGRVPDTLLDAFAALLTDAEWLQWRSRLLLQAKLTRDGGKPAPGHEAGRGVRKG